MSGIINQDKDISVSNLKIPIKCHARRWENKEMVRCLFCGGPKCKRCGIDAYLKCENPAFEKLHSNWITSSILAIQRPSDNIFDNENMIEKWVAAGITAIFNLTEPGEHPYCGDGVVASGFPYTPEKLMDAKSKFKFLLILRC